MHSYPPSEHSEQVALFSWLAYASQQDPRLALAFAVPNGGHRDVRVAVKLKAEGVRRGVPDVFLCIPSGGIHGLFIEMKKQGGRPTKEQREWIKGLRKMGYAAEICEGFEEAKAVIHRYLGQKPMLDPMEVI